ncbi:MAG TPA: site-2 protease family protein [Planctomycetota bacterium]|jgi:Zn-dependent protease
MELILQSEPRRTPGDLNWKFLGIPVRVHPSFWLASLLLCYTSIPPFGVVLVTIGCMFLSIFVHELGHALCYCYYGDRRPSMVLYWLGGLCKGKERNDTHWAHIAICLWGPGAGLILGAVAYGIGAYLFGPLFFWRASIAESQIYAFYALNSTFWFSVIWGLMNLLPVFPLDGGQVLRHWAKWKNWNNVDPRVFRISFYAALTAAVLLLAFYVFLQIGNKEADDKRNIFPALMFAWLAFNSYMIGKQLGEGGSLDGEDAGPRQAWERDGDWWKN